MILRIRILAELVRPTTMTDIADSCMKKSHKREFPCCNEEQSHYSKRYTHKHIGIYSRAHDSQDFGKSLTQQIPLGISALQVYVLCRQSFIVDMLLEHTLSVALNGEVSSIHILLGHLYIMKIVR